MRKVDLRPLINNDTIFQKKTEAVKEKYRCHWDDPVHDSFARYVTDAEKWKESIHDIRCKAETLNAQMEAHSIEKLINEAKALQNEANEICI